LCLIDGFFDSRPAPWHKELLVLMAKGTLIFGAASMGALRAVEIHQFGMIGVGSIFQAYHEGRLEGDDEVALIHADERLRWAPLTVPMVEMRATLQAACRAGVLDAKAARSLRLRLHDVHFEDRDWPLMKRVCVSEGLIHASAFDRLQAMHVPLKRLDALACLKEALIARQAATPTIPPPATCFIRSLARSL
jgi:hypothetical protein